MKTNTFDFIGGHSGERKVISMVTVCGQPLETVLYIDILPNLTNTLNEGIWTLTGFYE